MFAADVPEWAKQPVDSFKDFLKPIILDMAYPVGTIYESVNNVSPAEFLGGTWVEWGAGKVIVGVDDSDADFEIDSEGGSKTSTLSVSNLPSHKHTGSSSGGSHSHTASSADAGSHSHAIYVNGDGAHAHAGSTSANPHVTHYSGMGANFWQVLINSTDKGTVGGIKWPSSGSQEHRFVDMQPSAQNHSHTFTTANAGHSHTGASAEAGSHSHSVTVNTSTSHSHTITIGNTGSGTAFNNLQPYVTCYRWKRIS